MQTFQPKSDSNLSKARVLIAEDDKDTQLLLACLVDQTGAKSVTVDNGRECVEQALVAWSENKPFDVILLDIQMPEMDGLEAARALRGQGYSRPIVAMSARSTNSDEQEVLNSGCTAYVSKLNGRDNLIAAVSDVLNEHSSDDMSVELPILPLVPEFVHANPEHASSVLKLLNNTEHAIPAIEAAIKDRNFDLVKTITLQLGASSLFGYTMFADMPRHLQVASGNHDLNELKHIYPQFKRAAAAVVAGRRSIESIALKSSS